jgi:hypothetical protein
MMIINCKENFKKLKGDIKEQNKSFTCTLLSIFKGIHGVPKQIKGFVCVSWNRHYQQGMNQTLAQ